MKTTTALLMASAAMALAACTPAPDPGKVQPSVLRVVAVRSDTPDTITSSLGSAFVVAEGYVVTNNHVVEKGELFALYGSGLKDSISARVVARSETLDIALLSTGSDLKRPPLTLGMTPPKAGGFVYSVGYPAADEKLMNAEKAPELAPVKNGNVSQTGLGSWGGAYQFPMIQHTASINHGNSGGPLLDACNNVVGVNTAGIGADVTIGLDKNNHLTGKTDIAPGTFQASASSELAKYLHEHSIVPRQVHNRCGTPGTSTVAAGGVAMVAALGGGLFYYRRRRGGGRGGAFGGLFDGLRKTTALKVGGAGLPERGLRLVGASAGGALSFDLPRERFANTQGAVTVGRNPQMCDVVIQGGRPADKAADETVSRSHARFLWKDASFWVEDYGKSGEGSANKTYLNGDELPPASPRRVRAGDKVRFGQHEFQIFDL